MNPYEQLRAYKFYNGKQEPKKISASQCGAPVLQLYLSQTCKVVEQPNVFSKATIGSISHIGMESVIQGPEFKKEHFMERELPNGWKITGTTDLLDENAGVVYDYKFQMNFAYKQLFKAGPDESYNMQGAAYSWLDGRDYDFHIMSFITDHSPIKKDHPAESIQVTQMPIYDNLLFESKMLAKTDELQYAIDSGSPPVECDDLWWRVVNGTKVKTRCAYYCNYKDVCPYYTPHQKSAAKVASWGM